MNSFELNKIFGAILGTLVFVMGVGFIADEIYRPIENRGATYLLPEPEVAEAGGETAAPEVDSIAVRMQTATPQAGERLINRCQSCHDYSPANANRAGPGIYDVVGQQIAHHAGFSYSDVLVEMGAAGEVWDYENLDEFLASPRNFAPGTKMTFAGLSNPMDRANLIAFMRSLSEDPYPLPEGGAAAEAEGEAAAEEAVEEPAAAEEEAVVEEAAEEAAEEEAAEDDTGVDGAPVVDVEGPAEQTPSALEEIDQPGN